MRLQANALSFNYLPGKPVLHDVSLSVDSGETLYILGRNGSGKTTLLSCLAGLLQPIAGEVLLDGQNIQSLSPAERARQIGLIPQMHTPVFGYTVSEMVMMGRAPHLGWLGSPSHEDRAIVEESLAQVGIFELRDRPYTEISGGEQQLVLIARGLAQQCRLLLMDEPTAHLDLSNQHRVLEIVSQLSDRGITFIISSHSPNNALAYAGRVLLLTEGRVTASGTPGETLTEAQLSAVYGLRAEVVTHPDGRPAAVIAQRPMPLTPDSLKEEDSPLRSIFARSEQTPQLILVTGLSGVGKTTWCTRLVELARTAGYTVGGLLSPSIFRDGRKVGIEVVNLAKGDHRQLAVLREGDSARVRTPRWAFDPDALTWANQVLAESDDSDLLVIDEIGPLEFKRGEGLTAGLARLDSKDYRVAAVVVRSALLPQALQRWPNAIVVNGGTLPHPQ
ncbi:ATP-binding cassette domain-containing protein [bacterium]|nr:ATP-binding cassette domain-containing protein [bacterium]